MTDAPASGVVLLMPALYNDALELLATAHDYFMREGETDQQRMNERERVMYASEMSRVTMRLSCIMAWLMIRKAVLSGRIGEEEAQLTHRLDCNVACSHQNIEAESLLPPGMSYLLDESFELYQRIVRLDNEVARAASSHEGA